MPLGKRLGATLPFALNGEFAVENLYAAEAVQLMRFLGPIAVQIHDLPDGTPAKRFVEK